jgi:hypothetical protein
MLKIAALGGKLAAEVFLFADDTSVLVIDRIPNELDLKLSAVLQIINNWFTSNLLSINFQKAHCMQFTTKNF